MTSQQAVAAPASASPSKPSEPRPLKVLVVENDASSRELLARVMRLHGCNADTAIGAQQAFTLLQRTPYDLLITDLRMEPTDGVDLLRHVAAMESDRRPRLSIVLSGFLQDYYDKLSALDLPLELFQKPLHLPSLVSILERLRGEQGQAA
jgi:two-component system, OmpR family, response regulator